MSTVGGGIASAILNLFLSLDAFVNNNNVYWCFQHDSKQAENEQRSYYEGFLLHPVF